MKGSTGLTMRSFFSATFLGAILPLLFIGITTLHAQEELAFQLGDAWVTLDDETSDPDALGFTPLETPDLPDTPPTNPPATPDGGPAPNPPANLPPIEGNPPAAPATPPQGVTPAGNPPVNSNPSDTPSDPQKSGPEATPSGNPADRQNPTPPTAEPEPKGSVPSPSAPEETDSASRETEEEIPIISTLFQIPDPATSAIRGVPLTLADLLKDENRPPQRRLRAEAYWDLAEKLALYHLAVVYANDVEECVARYQGAAIPRNEQAVLLSARRVAQQGLREAEVDFIQAQFDFVRNRARLSDVSSNNRQTFQNESNLPDSMENLPIPVDSPTTVTYATRYDQIRRERNVAPETAYLNEMIPIQFEGVKAREREMDETLTAFKTLYFANSVSDELLLSAANRHFEAKKRLLHAVIVYNRMIAAYSSGTVGGNVQGERLMMTMNQSRNLKEMSVANDSGVIPIPTETASRGGDSHNVPVSAVIPNPISEAPRSARPERPARPITPSDTIPEFSPLPDNKPIPSPTPVPIPTETPVTFRGETSEILAGKPFSFQMDDFGILAQPTYEDLNDPGKPTVLPPKSGGEQAEATPPADDSEEAKNAKEGDKTLNAKEKTLTPEEDEKLHQITATLFPVNVAKSGGGDTKIVEIPLSLHEAVAQIKGDDVRTRAVESYWRLRTLIASLDVERSTFTSASEMLENVKRSGASGPEFDALIATWTAFLSASEAEMAELRVRIRAEQVNLMGLTNRSTDLGWPIPSSFPCYGPYSLASGSAKVRSFQLTAESILIPEKIDAIWSAGFSLGEPENLFTPEIDRFEKMDDGYLYLKTLENKRRAALGYLRMVESLNDSIARYVTAFAPNLDAQRYADCLVGSETE